MARQQTPWRWGYPDYIYPDGSATPRWPWIEPLHVETEVILRTQYGQPLLTLSLAPTDYGLSETLEQLEKE